MKSRVHSDKGSSISGLSVLAPSRQAAERAERLRQTARNAGGNVALARLSGVPLGTLNKYLAGGEMKLTAAVALAEAGKVSLEWLAMGLGSAQTADKTHLPNAGPEPSYRSIFSQVKIDTFASAYDSVRDHFRRQGIEPDSVPFMQATILLYDMVNDPEMSRPGRPHENAGRDED